MKKKRKKKQPAKLSQHEDAARKATEVDAEVIRKVEAVIYIMADKFLDSKEMEQLKEEIKMTRLGRMLYDDGKMEGEKNGAKAKLKEQVGKKAKKGYSVAEIADILEEDTAVIEEIMKEL